MAKICKFPCEPGAAVASQHVRFMTIEVLKVIAQHQGTETAVDCMGDTLIAVAGVLNHVGGRDRLIAVLTAICDEHGI
jgi:hypothetical protein